ncbi:hypothetical protein [Peribacillus deserti]|uniref:hypothetical protein n=1 Tax=Peribacillus deserti TaxID=673318 RepID=UPI0015E1081E|nr:hypothetical protein [Peribacillus deserti]
MLVLKRYFLSEIERYKTEKAILEAEVSIQEKVLLSLDDAELLQLYREKVEALQLA